MAANREIRRAIGDRLKEVRVGRKQSQEQVAKELVISRQMINRYENGHDAPTGERLLKILHYVGDRVDLPRYSYAITTEALKERMAEAEPAKQLNLEWGKPTELANSYVRIVPKRNTIEILIVAATVGKRRRSL